MEKLNELLNKMRNGERVFLYFENEQTDGECTWNNEEWSYDGDYFVCKYDGEGSTRHDEDEMRFAFNFDIADSIDVE